MFWTGEEEGKPISLEPNDVRKNWGEKRGGGLIESLGYWGSGGERGKGRPLFGEGRKEDPSTGREGGDWLLIFPSE